MRGYTRDVNVKGRKALGDGGGQTTILKACSTLKLKKVIYLVIRLSWLPSDVEYNIGDEDGDLFRLLTGYFGIFSSPRRILRRMTEPSEVSQATQPSQYVTTDVRRLPCFNPREDANTVALEALEALF